MKQSAVSSAARKRLSVLKASVGASILIALSASANAQSETAGTTKPSDYQGGTIETVVVTAAHREERLMDVSQSVTALTDRDLKAMDAKSFADYVGAVPNVQFTTLGPGQTTITIRGISDAEGVSTIGYYLNDTPITSRDTSGNNQPDPKTFDVDRIEVLRGPQGTLYGGGSMGGNIRVITKQPDLENFGYGGEVTGSGTAGGGGNYDLDGMINVPVVEDKFAIRVAGTTSDYDGWIDDPYLGKNVNRYRANTLRTEAKFAPTDDLSFTFLYENDWLHTDANNLADLATRGVSTLGQFSPYTDGSQLYSLTANYDLHWAALTAVAAYSNRDFTTFQPFSNGTIAAYTFAFGLPTGTITGGGADLGETTRDYNGEVRLVSEGDGPFRWTVGAYYLNSSVAGTTNVFILPSNAVPFIPGGIFLNSLATQKVEHYAVYGEGTYDVTDHLALTVGLRWFDETVDVGGVSNGNGLTGTVKSDKLIKKGTVTYKFDDTAMVYFTYADGFRSGGANLGVDPGAPLTYQPDTTENFELGAKTSWLDGRVDLIGALYHIDWHDMQVYNDPSPPQTIGYIDNGGHAKSEGAELEIDLRPIERLSISINGSYTDAVLTKLYNDDGLIAPAGNWLPYVPRWKGYASAEYTFPLWNDLTGRVRGDVQVVGKSWASILNANFPGDVNQPSYTLADFSAGLFEGRWSADIFVHNAFDARAILRNDTFGNFYENRPRTIGITLRYNH
ncbi:MAG: TonB-dependent receptor [Rhizomicrobium sp.]